MKKEVIVLILLGILLVSPLVLAQEQAQTYPGFDRFMDNIKMFFSSGDNKVRLALEIREKEVNSAIINDKNSEDKKTDKNLERAWKKLQFVQEKVSVDVAEEIKESSNKIKNKINNEENLSDNFEIYVLEEEKTGLKAEWIIEHDGEGGTLTREVVTDGIEGRTIEIEKRMDEIDNEIKEWVVDSFDKTIDSDDGLTWEVANKIIKEDGDDGLTREIKTHIAGDGTDNNDIVDNTVDPGPQGIVGNQGDGGMAPGTSGTSTDDDVSADDGSGGYSPGTTAEGDGGIASGTIDNTGDDVSGGGGPSEPGDSGAGDSGSDSGGSDTDGDSSSGGSSSDSGTDSSGDSAPVTGEVIRNSDPNNLIKKIFDWLF